jgi:nucleoside-diphosphate-sugar epimerase
MSYLLLTGATGLVGQYLLRDLLRQGMALAVLIRGRNQESAQERLARLLDRWKPELRAGCAVPMCLEGSVNYPDLGLSGPALRWLAQKCTGVIHSAVGLNSKGRDRRHASWFTSLGGTGNVLDLCRRLDLEHLHYLSTAYVCGDRQGPVLEEELEGAQNFRDEYEHSKYAAEKMVRGAGLATRPTIYRPAVIVGDSRTGFTTSYHGLYTYLRFAWHYCSSQPRQPDGRLFIPVRLNMSGEETRNLVPIDWVSAVITHVVGQPCLHGCTYHLTPTAPVQARVIEVALRTYFHYHGPVFVGPAALRRQELSDPEKLFYDHVARCQLYWRREPFFDCRNTLRAAPHLPCPRLDVLFVHRLLEYAIRDRWGKGRPQYGVGVQPGRQEALPVT